MRSEKSPRFAPGLEYDERRDTVEVEATEGVLPLLDVDLDDFKAPFVLLCDARQRRCHSTTGAAPACPEIRKNRRIRGPDVLVEVVLIEFFQRVFQPPPGPVCQYWISTSPTSAVAKSSGSNPVLESSMMKRPS